MHLRMTEHKQRDTPKVARTLHRVIAQHNKAVECTEVRRDSRCSGCKEKTTPHSARACCISPCARCYLAQSFFSATCSLRCQGCPDALTYLIGLRPATAAIGLRQKGTRF